MRTHPFTSVDGHLLRVIERSEGDVRLETSRADALGLCRITGPEILKLSEQGRALWNALSRLAGEFDHIEDDLDLGEDRLRAALGTARETLSKTATTFDPGEPEETLGDVLDAFKAGIAVGPVGSPEYLAAFAEATAKRDAPIPLVPSDIVTAVRKEIHRGED
jgi:hypothetical protein